MFKSVYSCLNNYNDDIFVKIIVLAIASVLYLVIVKNF